MAHRSPLKKRFGQHHLRSIGLCAPLIRFMAPRDRLVVEIGPGGGVLTEALYKAGARVVALEVDLDWALGSKLRQLSATSKSAASESAASKLRQPSAKTKSPVQVVTMDAQYFPWHRLPEGTLVTGNLPFNVATPLIEAVLQASAVSPARLPLQGFMVQKEVADRLTAVPSTKAYGALSVLVQARAKVRQLGTVAARDFRPPPKVDAAFVGFEPRPPSIEAKHWPRFRRCVYLAFSQRRKTLRNSLGSGWGKEKAAEIIEAADLDPKVRAEVLDVASFVKLTRASLDHDVS